MKILGFFDHVQLACGILLIVMNVSPRNTDALCLGLLFVTCVVERYFHKKRIALLEKNIAEMT